MGLALLLSGAVCLIVLIYWASLRSGIGAGMRYLLADRWGVVTLIDLLAGLLLVALWIAALEPSWWRRVFWWLGLLCLGNLTSLLFFAWRFYRCGTVSEALFKPNKTENLS
ncbi:MAG: hypothetical protein ACPGXK_05265 [Phycisphaerae bacterium]